MAAFWELATAMVKPWYLHCRGVFNENIPPLANRPSGSGFDYCLAEDRTLIFYENKYQKQLQGDSVQKPLNDRDVLKKYGDCQMVFQEVNRRIPGLFEDWQLIVKCHRAFNITKGLRDNLIIMEAQKPKRLYTLTDSEEPKVGVAWRTVL